MREGNALDSNVVREQISNLKKEFMKFIGINDFPDFDLSFTKLNLLDAESQGYGVLACAKYTPETKNHILCLDANFELYKYLIFHEFTHIIDSELYVGSSVNKYIGLSGYTEYHASQIELAQLIGSKNINEISPFSMKKKISTIAGKRTVQQYLNEKYLHAIELFERDDFPKNIEMLRTAIGVLHNYWGLRSICEMYSVDYKEEINNSIFLDYIPSSHFSALNQLMHGWLSNSKINMSIVIYSNIILPIIKDYKLD